VLRLRAAAPPLAVSGGPEMAELPDPIQRLDRYFMAARIAHEYIADKHRELAELQADDARSRALLRDSAAVVFEEMPLVTRQLREEGRDWDEQQLLEPEAAERTLASLTARLAELEPALRALRARQDEIAVSIRERVQAAGRA
jgi:hypothetical protein